MSTILETVEILSIIAVRNIYFFNSSFSYAYL